MSIIIRKTFVGFKKWLSNIHDAKNVVNDLEQRNIWFDSCEKEYINARDTLEKLKILEASLSVKEMEVFSIYSSNMVDSYFYDNFPELRPYLDQVFEKWCELFKNNKIYKIDYIKLGQKLFYYRKKEGYTLAKMSEVTVIDRSVISLFEKGKRKVNLDYLYSFSKIFGLRIDALLK